VSKDKKLQKQYRKGRDLYATSCGACHQLHGKGLENIAPHLAKSDWVTGDSKKLVAVALHGVTGPIKVNGKDITGVPPIMPGHSFMNDEQLADILTYVRNAWGNKASSIAKKEVAEFRTANPNRFMPWTVAELEALK